MFVACNLTSAFVACSLTPALVACSTASDKCWGEKGLGVSQAFYTTTSMIILNTCVQCHANLMLQVLSLGAGVTHPDGIVPPSGWHRALLTGAPLTEPLPTCSAMVLPVFGGKLLVAFVTVLDFGIWDPVHRAGRLNNHTSWVLDCSCHQPHCRLHHFTNIASSHFF